ncbi:transposase [Virgibacillus dokdonensis]|uniref:transposase n=1 Tax=Virgibacillus dokdonensis TaxID=302167 RepID=UPI0039E00468
MLKDKGVAIHYHIVFIPKYRRKVMRGQVRKDLFKTKTLVIFLSADIKFRHWKSFCLIILSLDKLILSSIYI